VARLSPQTPIGRAARLVEPSGGSDRTGRGGRGEAPLLEHPHDVRPPTAGAGIDAFARFVGVDLRPRPEPTPEELAEVERLAAQVLAHFDHHRPGPDSFPSLSLRIFNLVANPDEVDVGELVRLVSQDPALAAMILRLANSAALRGATAIENVRDAVTWLGLRDVATVAGALATRSLFNPSVRAEFAYFRRRWRGLFLDAVTVAMGCTWLSMQTGAGRSDRAFLGGLLHDVGKSLALKSIAALQHTGRMDPALTDLQIERILERVHVHIGAEVHQEWALPAGLTAVCLGHHDRAVPAAEDHLELHFVRVVSGLRQLRVAPAIDPGLPEQIEQSLRVLALDPFRFRALDTQLVELADRTTIALGA
jgi:HD-like signal output (HDOD) protein